MHTRTANERLERFQVGGWLALVISRKSGCSPHQGPTCSPASVTKCSAPTLSVGVNTNNQITNTSFAYDAAGNLTGDGSFSYTWDVESRMKSAAGVNYTYDGDDRRVVKSNGKLYWYGGGSDPLAESDAAGNNPVEYVFFGGKRIARRDASGNINYYFADHLGTSRVVTSATGAILDDSDFYPFGGAATRRCGKAVQSMCESRAFFA
jgi:uncharacterized protein RhaS with RHS repeats